MQYLKKRKIKSCPFCNNKDPQLEFNDLIYFVFCNGCGTSGPAGHDKDEAIIIWNAAKR